MRPTINSRMGRFKLSSIHKLLNAFVLKETTKPQGQGYGRRSNTLYRKCVPFKNLFNLIYILLINLI